MIPPSLTPDSQSTCSPVGSSSKIPWTGPALRHTATHHQFWLGLFPVTAAAEFPWTYISDRFLEASFIKIEFKKLYYGCESWTIKKAEHQRIHAFKLWCWRVLLRVPWTARRSNQSILKEISPEYSLEGLMLKLKLQYVTWCEEPTYWKNPVVGKDWEQEETGTT